MSGVNILQSMTTHPSLLEGKSIFDNNHTTVEKAAAVSYDWGLNAVVAGLALLALGICFLSPPVAITAGVMILGGIGISYIH